MKGYSETLEYLYGLEKLGTILGLDNVRWILSLLGDPQDSFESIHIAGTNGKGSVASMVSTVLLKAGYRTGAYTSPHLISFTERITVDGTAIREEEVVELTQFIKERIDRADRNRLFTFFDFTTALAFVYFKRKGVRVALVEVGLGGRLDSTNVVCPVVSVITNVELDHQDYLGNTIEEIAREKAGIIKDNVPIVTGAGDPALTVIRDIAANRSDLYVLGEAFSYLKKGEQTMSYKGIKTSFDDVSLSLRGDHQLHNAALALCVLELLGTFGYVLDESHVRKGVASTDWPGRLELTDAGPGKPMILYDGAHNPDGARTLAAFLKTHFPDRRKILVFGVMKDKAFEEMLEELLPAVQHTIVTRPEIARAARPADVAAFAPGAQVTDSIGDALGAAFKMAGSKDLIIIAGSFYTIGEAKRLLDKQA
jgi:dihydrofolate synthase / folylpolyglutamate synthase